jgi:hypothetical protein
MLLGRKAGSEATVGRKPCQELSSKSVAPKIHGLMLLGKEAESEASVGGKPVKGVSLQECPAVSESFPFSSHKKWKRII